MTGTVHAFDFLGSEKTPVPGVCVLFGDESFLKRLAKSQLRRSVLGDDADAPFVTFDGSASQWCDVSDELSTPSLFGGGTRRLVIIDDADNFVSEFRANLETVVASPKRTGVLVLDVGTWASNTRLYKAVEASGLQVDCRLPHTGSGKWSQVDERRVGQWLETHAAARHQIALQPTAARLLVEIGGADLGVLDQHLAKLALFVKPNGKVSAELVQQIVGGWRAKTIWQIIDAAADGNAADALRHLDRAFQSGEPPLAMFGQISWSLRRFAVATRAFERSERRGERMPLRQALQEAGFRNWPADALGNAERQLKQLGRERAGKMLPWLLQADLALKGSHSSPERARLILEQLFLRMARQSTPAKQPAAQDRPRTVSR